MFSKETNEETTNLREQRLINEAEDLMNMIEDFLSSYKQ